MYRFQRFDAAYYLEGYVIECALKACIAKKTRRHDFPDEDIAYQVYTHDLKQLLKHAGIEPEVQHEFDNDPALEVRWGIVKDWKEKSRYERLGRNKAKAMVDAVADPKGVFACFKKFW